MDAAQTEKLKALALAYSYENGEHWFNEFELADGVTYEPGVNFIITANPATVLALIAEVERLRAASAAKTVEIDERYEFQRHMSQRGEAANYIGDGMFHNGAVQDQWEAWLARAAIAASKEKA